MTCFWTGILHQLTNADLMTIGLSDKSSNQNLVNQLKARVTKTTGVLWNGSELSDKELEENLEHIRDFNVNSINHGYLCSSCDPFLLLLAKLLNVNIHHTFLRASINYSVTNPTKTLHFASNQSHFWSVGKPTPRVLPTSVGAKLTSVSAKPTTRVLPTTVSAGAKLAKPRVVAKLKPGNPGYRRQQRRAQANRINAARRKK